MWTFFNNLCMRTEKNYFTLNTENFFYNFDAFILTFALSNTPAHWKEKLNYFKQQYDVRYIVLFNIHST